MISFKKMRNDYSRQLKWDMSGKCFTIIDVKKVIENIKEAAEFALQSPFPKKEDLYTDVYL